MIFNNSFYVVSHGAAISFLFWTSFSFSSYFFIYQLDFCFDPWIFCHLLANLFPCFWLFLVLFWMLWRLVTAHNPCHVPHASRITYGIIFTEIFLDVSKEWVRSWSHAFLITNLKMLAKKLSAVHPEKVPRRKKRKKKLEWQLQSASLNANAIIKLRCKILLDVLHNFRQ